MQVIRLLMLIICVAAVGAIPAQEFDLPKKKLLAFGSKLSPASIRMKRELEKRPEDAKRIAAAYTVKIHDLATDRDVAEKYGVTEVPACVMLGTDGKEIKRFVGYKSVNDLLRWLDLECPH